MLELTPYDYLRYFGNRNDIFAPQLRRDNGLSALDSYRSRVGENSNKDWSKMYRIQGLPGDNPYNGNGPIPQYFMPNVSRDIPTDDSYNRAILALGNIYNI
jgi:hypothetical protein